MSMTWLLALGIVWTISLLTLLLRVAHKFWLSVLWSCVLPHCVLVYRLLRLHHPEFALPVTIANGIGVAVFASVFLFHMPKYEFNLSRRLRIMMGGRRIFMVSLVAGLVQIPMYVALILKGTASGLENGGIIWDMVLTYCVLSLFMFVGAMRLFVTSRRLGAFKRVVMILFAWMPPVNVGIGIWFCHIVKKEFVHDYLQTELQNARQESMVCATRYPLLMLHGVGFRDYNWINYWGRIPALLKKNGAMVYHGHQQAWGRIEDNAVEIQSELRGILAQTGAEKVNIIAHSKGGLDARYLISSLNMGPYVASLTTMSTPHHGSELLQVLEKLPERTYRSVCRWINAYFGSVGDHAPDAYQASRQLHPEFLKKFNRETPDVAGVYYQSYAAEMTSPFSSSLLMAPFSIMKWVSQNSQNNDGLVTINSAKWGDFKGTIKSTRVRGISHGDLIDLVRQDYEGFNIAEEYVKIVSELKQMGF